MEGAYCFPGKAVNTPYNYIQNLGFSCTYLKGESHIFYRGFKAYFPSYPPPLVLKKDLEIQIWKDSHIWKP